MNTKTLSDKALSVIDQYENFKIGKAICSVPYFNNKTARYKTPIRALKGKGSPKDIYEEVMSILIKSHADQNLLNSESLKKILTDNNIGIDCSGFVYHILDAESETTKKKPLKKYINFVKSRGLFGKIKSKLRPVENCDVNTFAHEKNSKVISISDILPGDIITMIGGPDNKDRDHILLIYKVEYKDNIPTKIFYTHAVAYPEDGIYGTGIKKGIINITDTTKYITNQQWVENNKTDSENTIFIRANRSHTKIRRFVF